MRYLFLFFVFGEFPESKSPGSHFPTLPSFHPPPSPLSYVIVQFLHRDEHNVRVFVFVLVYWPSQNYSDINIYRYKNVYIVGNVELCAWSVAKDNWPLTRHSLPQSCNITQESISRPDPRPDSHRTPYFLLLVDRGGNYTRCTQTYTYRPSLIKQNFFPLEGKGNRVM